MRREPIETRKAKLASIPTKEQPAGKRLNEPQGRPRVPTRLDWAPKGSSKAAGIALEVRAIAGLAEVQEPEARAVNRPGFVGGHLV
jgi:hypothetical protein